MIAALGLGGVLAPPAFPGATDTAAFQTYVDMVLVPELHAGDVVVFDNLKPHLASGVARAIEHAGAKVLPLPPYSSDYTPIEELWSKAKQYLRRAAARSRWTLHDAFVYSCEHVTTKYIRGWFQHAGLCSSDARKPSSPNGRPVCSWPWSSWGLELLRSSWGQT